MPGICEDLVSVEVARMKREWGGAKERELISTQHLLSVGQLDAQPVFHLIPAVRKVRSYCSHFKKQVTEPREEPISLSLGSHSTKGKIART